LHRAGFGFALGTDDVSFGVVDVVPVLNATTGGIVGAWVPGSSLLVVIAGFWPST
jgi:hypothetical protein